MATSRHAEIIQQLGGYVHLAGMFGLNPETVKSWTKWNRGIPPRYWHRVATMAPGLTAAYLERTKPGAVPVRMPRQRRYRAAAE